MKVFLAGTVSRKNYIYDDIISCRRKWKDKDYSKTNGGGGMQLYLAGGFTGNLRADWKEFAERERKRELMKIYLAGEHETKNGKEAATSGGQGIYILESFYTCRENKWIPKLIPSLGGFLLDSGAFTFLNGYKGKVNFDDYTERYAEWVKAYNIQDYIEMDLDSIIGLKEVERLRAKLERLVGWQPIPVWHKNRGKDYFVSMCKDYKYVAIGGIVTQEIKKTTYEKGFPWFINTAHCYGAKIHGLGYTSCANLRKFHFDSVDSTSWLYGNRGGYLYRFNPNREAFFDKINVPEGKRLEPRLSSRHNFGEWVKFQQYAIKNL